MIIADFSDVPKFINYLEQLPVKNMLGRSLKKACDKLVGDMIKITPVDTGEMKASWTTSSINYKNDSVSIDIFNDANTPRGYYASWVNDGHRLRNGAWWEGYHVVERGIKTASPENIVEETFIKEFKGMFK